MADDKDKTSGTQQGAQEQDKAGKATEAGTAAQAKKAQQRASRQKAGAKADQTPHRRGIAVALIIGGLGVVFGLGIGAYGLYSAYAGEQNRHQQKSRYQQQAEQLQTRLASLETRLNKVDGEQQQLQERLSRLQNRDQQIKSAVNEALGRYEGRLTTLQQGMKQLRHSYLLPEARLHQQVALVNTNAARLYLNLAAQVLWLADDRDAALRLLHQATVALQEENDDNSAAAAAKIRQVRMAVQAGKRQSMNQILQQLQKLSSLSGQLVLLKPAGAAVDKPDANAGHDSGYSWREALGQSWQRLQSLVTVTHLDSKQKALLDPDSRRQMVFLLKLYVDEARVALLRHNQEAFNERLQQARQLVSTYFKTDSAFDQWVEQASSIHYPRDNRTRQAFQEAREAVRNLAQKQTATPRAEAAGKNTESASGAVSSSGTAQAASTTSGSAATTTQGDQ